MCVFEYESFCAVACLCSQSFCFAVLPRVLKNNQPGTPPVENVPTLEQSKSAPTGNEAAQPMATDVVVGTAKAATPDVDTSVAAPEPWMNHLRSFLLDPFSCRSVKV